MQLCYNLVGKVVSNVGMSNEQFDSYKTRILRDLERIKKSLPEENEDLEILIADLKSELKKP